MYNEWAHLPIEAPTRCTSADRLLGPCCADQCAHSLYIGTPEMRPLVVHRPPILRPLVVHSWPATPLTEPICPFPSLRVSLGIRIKLLGKPVAKRQSEEQTSTLPVAPGRDHAALAVLPFTLALRDPEQHTGPVTFAYEAEVDGKLRRVSVTLEPGADGHLPVHADQMVYLALLQLALAKEHPHDTVTFRRGEVFDLLRMTGKGRDYERLRGALHRLAGMLLVVNSALVARDGTEYRRGERGSHLIDEYEIGDDYNAPCRVVWGQMVREAFRLGDFKRLDWDLLLALGNPLTAQLYRLIDRATMAGHTQWAIGWSDLAQALGMKADAYARPARFRQVLNPHVERLEELGVLDSSDYARGGEFVFYIRNYLRAQLRQSLEDLGVYADAARQLVAGYDEQVIMAQVDCLQHGQRGNPASPGGYLTKAIREGFELRYPDDEPQAFSALWSGLFGAEERRSYHAAALGLCGAADSLFETSEDPTAWPVEFRAVVRFMMTHNLDPELVLRQPASGLLGGVVG